MDNRISLYKLEVLCTVVELGGVTPAAARLFVSQPVVSEHIRSLEQRIGEPLFDRTAHGLELTEIGRAVHDWARDVLRRGTELDRELAGLSGGTVGAAAVATSMTVGSYLLPPIITRFVGANPGTRVTVHVFDPNQIWEAITSGQCDLAVPIAPRIPHGRGLTGETVGRQDLLLVTASGPDAPQGPVDVDVLATLPWISTPRSSIRREIEDAELAALGVGGREVIVEFGHPEAIKHAVGCGLGVALLFRTSVQREIDAGTLVEVPIQGVQLAVPVHVVWRSGKRRTMMQRALVDAIRVDPAVGGLPEDVVAQVY